MRLEKSYKSLIHAFPPFSKFSEIHYHRSSYRDYRYSCAESYQISSKLLCKV